jgi:hypothetical protein
MIKLKESPRCVHCGKKVHSCKCGSKATAGVPHGSSQRGGSKGCSYRAPIRPQE